MERFCGKVAVVTGSSSGIGAAVCRELVKYGVIVAGLARRIEKLEKLSEELSNSDNYVGKFYPLKCDVTKECDIDNCFEWITTTLGPIAILVNNVGVSVRSVLGEVDGESITKIFDTNVKAVVLCSKKAMKSMADNSVAGHIINVNSIAGHNLREYKPNTIVIYASSKHALKVISEGFRRELVNNNMNVKVTNLSPGHVSTEMTSDLSLFSPDTILEPKNIADACISVLNTPWNVEISELTIMPIHEGKNIQI